MLSLNACGTSVAKGPRAASTTRGSAGAATTTQPSRQPIETKVTCSSRPVTGHPLLLLQPGGITPELAVLDVLDPLRPQQLCKLSPANGGRFLSATKIAFWLGQQIGVADLTSDVAVGTAEFPKSTGVAFSPDGSAFAYSTGDETLGTAGTSTHLTSGG